MTRYRAVNRASRIKNAGRSVRRERGRNAARVRERPRRNRSPEIFGIAALGAAIFLLAGLVSLSFGDGRLMGPFGRSSALLLYSLVGLGGYAVCAVLIALRIAG